MAGITITTQDDLPGADGDQPYTLFVNQTEYGNARYRFAGLRLPGHQRPFSPARPQEVHRPALQSRRQAAHRCERLWGRRGAGVHGGPRTQSAADPGVQRPAPAAGGLSDRAGGIDRDPFAAAGGLRAVQGFRLRTPGCLRLDQAIYANQPVRLPGCLDAAMGIRLPIDRVRWQISASVLGRRPQTP